MKIGTRRRTRTADRATRQDALRRGDDRGRRAKCPIFRRMAGVSNRRANTRSNDLLRCVLAGRRSGHRTITTRADLFTTRTVFGSHLSVSLAVRASTTHKVQEKKEIYTRDTDQPPGGSFVAAPPTIAVRTTLAGWTGLAMIRLDRGTARAESRDRPLSSQRNCHTARASERPRA